LEDTPLLAPEPISAAGKEVLRDVFGG